MYEIAQEKLHLEQQITGNQGKVNKILFFPILGIKLTRYIPFVENENADKKSVIKLLKMTIGQDIHNKCLSSTKNSSKGTDILASENENCK